MARQAHLVGSVGLDDAETVFKTVSDVLGTCCPRIPDGETGERGYWIRWQLKTFAGNPALDVETVTQSLPGFKDKVERQFFRLKDGADPAALDLGQLGYAAEAIRSYETFARLADEGTIPQGVRFQVSVPTPMALVCGFVAAADRPRIEPAVERAMIDDLARMQAAIPHDRLAIQWDVCHEVIGCDGGPPLPYDDALGGSIARVARLCGAVEPDVALGLHLCYGDPGHKHIVEPPDLATCVAFANGICRQSPRPVDYVHMPVPRDRSDAAYFKPLEGLDVPDGTRLVLGLVHFTDGVDGSRARIASAEKFVADFDIATECGFGRRDPATIPRLLQIHRALCD